VTDPQPAVPDTDDPAPPADEAEQPERPSDNAEVDDFGGENVRGMTAAYIHFHAPVNVEGPSTFGVAGQAPGGFRRATGVVPPKIVDQALTWFTKPAEYDRALTLLRANRLVVLVGADGIGKQAFAFSLLRAACDGAAIVSMSPAASLTQLATAVKFKPQHGYLVADHIGDGTESAVRSFDADRLAEKVAGGPAHLVITTTSARIGRHLTRFAVQVTAPEPAALLAECVGETVVDPDVYTQVRAHIARLRRPQVIVGLARRLVECPGAALDAIRDQAKELVTDWFNGEVTKQELLSITVLAIAGSQPEPIHDRLVSGLLSHARPRPGEREAAPYVAPEHEKIKQRQRDHPLVVSVVDEQSDGDGWSSGRRVRFRDPAMRSEVLEALHERYDYQLWKPVESWIRELCTIEPGPAIQVELANGLALLARSDFAGIYGRFLDPWADGLAGERFAAAMVLWFMSEDDQLRTIALQTAMAWGQDRGMRRAVTSALALGGPLGVRFPGEALQRLCFLAMRAKRIGEVARLSVALLFAFAVEDGSDSTASLLTTVFGELVRAVTADGKRPWPGQAPLAGESTAADSYVATQLGKRPAEEQDEPYERGWSYRVTLAARWLVVSVLCAEHPDRADLIAAEIVLNQPENVELLGTLWADVLCSAPHAGAARKGLLRLLRALEHHQSSKPAVARLGAAVRAAMAPAHRTLRVDELMREANREPADRQPASTLVSTLLTALGQAPAPVPS
jgi:hypothetical protein